MAEELIGNLGYETPQSDTKGQKLLECVLTRNSKLYLGKVYTEEQLAKLSEEQEILWTPYLTRHRTGQVERLMACDQIEAKIMKYHTLSAGGMSAVNLAKFNRKVLLSSKSN